MKRTVHMQEPRSTTEYYCHCCTRGRGIFLCAVMGRDRQAVLVPERMESFPDQPGSLTLPESSRGPICGGATHSLSSPNHSTATTVFLHSSHTTQIICLNRCEALRIVQSGAKSSSARGPLDWLRQAAWAGPDRRLVDRQSGSDKSLAPFLHTSPPIETHPWLCHTGWSGPHVNLELNWWSGSGSGTRKEMISLKKRP